MRKIIYAFLFFLVVGGILNLFDDNGTPINTKPKKNYSNEENIKISQIKSTIDIDKGRVEELKKEDCVEVIRCLSPKEVAREYGRTEQWAVANYIVTVWEKPTHLGKGKKVGDMRCGSRAVILERSVDDYKIISPLDQSIGWVNEVQISGTSFQHPITRESCEK